MLRTITDFRTCGDSHDISCNAMPALTPAQGSDLRIVR